MKIRSIPILLTEKLNNVTRLLNLRIVFMIKLCQGWGWSVTGCCPVESIRGCIGGCCLRMLNFYFNCILGQNTYFPNSSCIYFHFSPLIILLYPDSVLYHCKVILWVLNKFSLVGLIEVKHFLLNMAVTLRLRCIGNLEKRKSSLLLWPGKSKYLCHQNLLLLVTCAFSKHFIFI